MSDISPKDFGGFLKLKPSSSEPLSLSSGAALNFIYIIYYIHYIFPAIYSFLSQKKIIWIFF